MATVENTIVTTDITVTPREIDFVTRFGRNWEHLMDIIGITRPIKKSAGAVLKQKYAEIAEGGLVTTSDEGALIPYTKFDVKEKTYDEMPLEKYAKAVSIEAIKANGYDVAVQLTDDEFLYELQQKVATKFYSYITTNAKKVYKTGTTPYATFQQALAMAKGNVTSVFKKLHRTSTGVVGFVNVLDVYEYLGSAEITVQSEFGFDYIKNFMGYDTIFLLGDDEVAKGNVYATSKENIALYYVDPSDSDFAKAGLNYATEGETSLVGFHAQGNYSTAVSECFAILGMVLFAEYVDGIVDVPFAASSAEG